MGQSWSGIKKRLEEDLICNSLKGRVKYFITKYRNSHDESGRVSIVVDNKEIIQGNIFIYYNGYHEINNKVKDELGIPSRQWTGEEMLYEKENQDAEKFIDKIRLEEGCFDVWQFTDAVEEFLHLGINESLNHNNPLIRLLAVLDRRAGKRTLEKLNDTIENQPDWLAFFYRLRFDAENMNTRK